MQNNLFDNIHYLLAAAWRRRYLIAVPSLLLPFIGLLLGVSQARIYQTHTTILLQETAKMNPFLEDFSVSPQLKDRMAALDTLLHSRHVLDAVAEEAGLVTEDSADESRRQVVDELSDALTVKLVGSDLIRLNYEADSPDGMEEILQTVSEQFTELLLAPERSSIIASESFLGSQLEKQRNDLLQAEQVLADYKNEHASELPVFHVGNVERLRQLRQQLAEREVALAGAQEALRSINDRLVQTNPVVGKLEERIVNLQSQLVILRARYTEQHSEVQAVQRKLKHLEQERQRLLASGIKPVDAQRLWNIAAAVRSNSNGNSKHPTLLVSQLEQMQAAEAEVKGLTQEVERLEQMVQELGRDVAGYGLKEYHLKELSRDLQVKSDLYDDLLNRFEKARVTGALGRFEESERIKVIDKPETPSSPSNPAFWVFLLAGQLAGITLGIGLATVLELTDTTLRRRDLIERLTGVPVISRIPDLAGNMGTSSIIDTEVFA